jgi:molybdenum ABC transporter molybdate-binding protein
MIKFLKIFLTLLLFCNFSQASESKNLTIFAESNLSVPLVKIIRKYSKEKNVIISINFQSSFDLIERIDEGEPADIFISSHNDWIDILKQKGLIDIYSISNIAEDNLVLISSNQKFITENHNIKNIKNIFQRISNLQYGLITESEHKSLGKYSNKIIEKYNIKPHIVFRKLNEDKKSIIDFVSENKNLFALVLESSILPNDNVQIIAKIPDIEINYQISAIAGDNMELARDFIKYLEKIEFKEYFN